MSVKAITKKKKGIGERAWLEELCQKTLTDQEAFEAKQDLLGAFGWLLEMDRKYNSERYKDE